MVQRHVLTNKEENDVEQWPQNTEAHEACEMGIWRIKQGSDEI